MPLSPNHHDVNDKLTRTHSSLGESTGPGSAKRDASFPVCRGADHFLLLVFVIIDLAACQIGNTRSVSSVGSSSRRDLQLLDGQSINSCSPDALHLAQQVPNIHAR